MEEPRVTFDLRFKKRTKTQHRLTIKPKNKNIRLCREAFFFDDHHKRPIYRERRRFLHV